MTERFTFPPSGVNLKALSSRCRTSWRTRSSSTVRWISFWSKCTLKLIFLAEAWVLAAPISPLTRETTSVWCRLNVTWLPSIFSRSSRLLTITASFSLSELTTARNSFRAPSLMVSCPCSRASL